MWPVSSYSLPPWTLFVEVPFWPLIVRLCWIYSTLSKHPTFNLNFLFGKGMEVTRSLMRHVGSIVSELSAGTCHSSGRLLPTVEVHFKRLILLEEFTEFVCQRSPSFQNDGDRTPDQMHHFWAWMLQTVPHMVDKIRNPFISPTTRKFGWCLVSGL